MIMEFKDQKEFKKFFKSKVYYEIGFGSEGSCYYGKDGLAYKEIENNYTGISRDIDSIITSEDYNLNFIALPIDIYTDSNHDEIYGYNSRLLRDDILQNTEDFFENICIDKLIDCYYRFIMDVKKFSNDNIYMFELINNLLFNNRQFLAIDTLDYYKKDHNTYDENIDIVLSAIEHPLYFATRDKAFSNSKSIEEIANNVKKYVKKRIY